MGAYCLYSWHLKHDRNKKHMLVFNLGGDSYGLVMLAERTAIEFNALMFCTGCIDVTNTYLKY